MSRLEPTFKSLKLKSKKALIPFVTAGHPHPLMTVPTLHALVSNGADIIELGMPFSDPMADGVVIQESSEIAIAKGMTLSSVLDTVEEFREKDKKTPIILMGYLNPIEKYGYENFVDKASKVGVDGLLIVDMPPEEATDLLLLLKKQNMSQIFLIAPTTTAARQKYLLSMSSGFVYCVALKGVTGSKNLDYSSLSNKMAEIRSLTQLPLAIGFGVNDVDSAQLVAQYADAVVIGSALVKKLGKCNNEKEIKRVVKKFIKPIAKALHKKQGEL